MNLTQKQLRMFVTTAAFANVSRASEVLSISQPALTRALQELEHQLGTALFVRTTRRVGLTPDGERFLPVAQRLLSDLERAVAGLRDGTHEYSPPVTVAVGTAFACVVLPTALKRLAATHPALQIRLIDDNSAGITARVASGEADLGIGSPVGDISTLELDPLLTAPIGLLGDLRKFKLGASVVAKDLPSLPLLKEPADTSIMHILRTHGSELVARMHRGVEVSNLSAQLALARCGVGVAVLSALGASHPQAAGLHFAPLKPVLRRELFFIRRRAQPPGESAAALIDAIRASLGKVKLHPLVR